MIIIDGLSVGGVQTRFDLVETKRTAWNTER